MKAIIVPGKHIEHLLERLVSQRAIVDRSTCDSVNPSGQKGGGFLRWNSSEACVCESVFMDSKRIDPRMIPSCVGCCARWMLCITCPSCRVRYVSYPCAGCFVRCPLWLGAK